MKKIILYLLFALILYNCSEKKEESKIIKNSPIITTYASDSEIEIFQNMKFWRSKSLDFCEFDIINYDKLKSEHYKLTPDLPYGTKYDYEVHYTNEKRKLDSIGPYLLSNNKEIIDFLRSCDEEMYKMLLTKRKLYSKELDKYKSKIPYFKDIIVKIQKGNPNYNYIVGREFGFLEKNVPDGEFFKKFSDLRPLTKTSVFNNYSSVLKNYYSNTDGYKINDNDILALNKILKSMDSTDRRLWIYKEYKKSKNEIQKNYAKKERKKNASKLFD